MGRAQQQPSLSSASRRLNRKPDLVTVLREFNAAAAQRAKISRLIADLAKDESTQAVSRRMPVLLGLASGIGLLKEFQQEEARLQEVTSYNLHTELRVALDEGRRVEEKDILALSNTAVDNAACGLLGLQLAEKEDLPTSDVLSWLRSYLSSGTKTAPDLSDLRETASLQNLLAEIS